MKELSRNTRKKANFAFKRRPMLDRKYKCSSADVHASLDPNFRRLPMHYLHYYRCVLLTLCLIV